MKNMYDTYQEAKIANPESDIYHYGEEFTASSKSQMGILLQPCNPADHCMSYRKFLADGYCFTEGDMYMNKRGELCHIMNHSGYNRQLPGDEDRYIIFSKMLEETKVDNKPQFQNGDTVYDEDGNECVYVAPYPHHDPVSVVINNHSELKTIETIKLSKTPPVKPKECEWWMCEVVTDEVTITQTTGQVLMYKNDNWVKQRDYLNIKPLYRMIRDTDTE